METVQVDDVCGAVALFSEVAASELAKPMQVWATQAESSRWQHAQRKQTTACTLPTVLLREKLSCRNGCIKILSFDLFALLDEVKDHPARNNNRWIEMRTV